MRVLDLTNSLNVKSNEDETLQFLISNNTRVSPVRLDNLQNQNKINITKHLMSTNVFKLGCSEVINVGQRLGIEIGDIHQGIFNTTLIRSNGEKESMCLTIQDKIDNKAVLIVFTLDPKPRSFWNWWKIWERVIGITINYYEFEFVNDDYHILW